MARGDFLAECQQGETAAPARRAVIEGLRRWHGLGLGAGPSTCAQVDADRQSLATFEMDSGDVFDLAVLREFPAIRHLSLRCRKPWPGDLSKQLAALPQLTSLELFSYWTETGSSCPIADLTPLTKLTNLAALKLEFVGVTDVTPLAAMTWLTSLEVGNNGIRDVEPLHKLIGLSVLDVRLNPIKDITPLMSLINLRRFDISGMATYIADPTSAHANIDAVSYMVNLEILNVGSTYVEDLGPVAGLFWLEELQLFDDRFTDLSPLKPLQRLRVLDVSSNPQLEDLAPVASLAALEEIEISRTKVKDQTPLAGLGRLKTIWREGLPPSPCPHATAECRP
jgi:hypothetical protein